MIISLEQAKLIDDKITQEDLDAFETSIRRLTNNNFQNKNVRFLNISIISEDIVELNERCVGLRIGDTIEINYSKYNDGLYTIKTIIENEITFNEGPLFVETAGGIMLTKVEYPADIAFNVKKLIAYDKKMEGKLGIKSESISRMSTTYYDMNSTENTEGYPSSLLSFLYKYEKMRW